MFFLEVLLSDCVHDLVALDFVFHLAVACVAVRLQQRAGLLRERIYPCRNNFSGLWDFHCIQELVVDVSRGSRL